MSLHLAELGKVSASANKMRERPARSNESDMMIDLLGAGKLGAHSGRPTSELQLQGDHKRNFKWTPHDDISSRSNCTRALTTKAGHEPADLFGARRLVVSFN